MFIYFLFIFILLGFTIHVPLFCPNIGHRDLEWLVFLRGATSGGGVGTARGQVTLEKGTPSEERSTATRISMM